MPETCSLLYHSEPMLLEVFARVMVPILVIVGAGYLFRSLTDLDVRPMSRISLYLLSPALIFTSLVEAEIAGGETLRVTLFMLLLVAAMAALSLLSGLVFGFSRQTNTAMMLCTMFSNTGNYGLPLAYFAFGQRGFEGAVLFFVLQGVLVQTLGVYLAGAGQEGWRSGLVRLMLMPQIYAVGAALLLRQIGPEMVTSSESVLNDIYQGIALMGEATIPVLLVILGVQLAESRIESADGLQISVATIIKLFIAVPISYGLARLVGLDELSTKLAVVLGSMPTAVNVTILAVEFDLRPKMVSGVVSVSTALSLVTLTVLLGVLGAG